MHKIRLIVYFRIIDFKHADMNMTTQLKRSLISRINASNDINFLEALQTLFDSSEQSLYQLTPEQNASILKGREEVSQGEFVENDQLLNEIKAWLTKK